MPPDYELAVEHLRRVDPALGRVIDRVGPCRIRVARSVSVFAALAESIVYQQLNGKAASTIFGRVCALYPRRRRGLTAKAVLATDDVALRGAGLSRNKLLALKDLAWCVDKGLVPSLGKLERMSDEDVIAVLTQVRGIGRWTAEMFLMFRLGRADVLAVDDLGLRQGHGMVVGLGGSTDRKELARHGERWRPYRSIASWYLWRAVELRRSAGR